MDNPIGLNSAPRHYLKLLDGIGDLIPGFGGEVALSRERSRVDECSSDDVQEPRARCCNSVSGKRLRDATRDGLASDWKRLRSSVKSQLAVS